jgi:hypothetical protein
VADVDRTASKGLSVRSSRAVWEGLFVLLVLLATAVALAMSPDLPTTARVPVLVVGAPLAVVALLSLGDVLLASRRRGREDAQDAPVAADDWTDGGPGREDAKTATPFVFAWFALFGSLAVAFGVLLGASVFALVFSKFYGGVPAWRAVVFGVGTFVCLRLLVTVLGIRVFEGLLPALL